MTYPTIRPELTLDFANSRQLDPRITFSRTSGATYLNPDTGLITLASDHEARFEKEGLLIEESRTNLLQQSESISTSPWGVFNSASVSANSTVAPDGTTTADTLGGTTPSSYIQQTIPWTASGNWSLSLFVKAGTSSQSLFSIVRNNSNVHGVRINWSGGVPTVDLAFGCSASIQPLASGWYRILLQLTSVDHTVANFFRFIPDLISGTGTVILWGVQAEQVRFPTSYIPTAGSTVTRAAELCSIFGTNYTSVFGTTLGSGSIFHDVKVLGEEGNTNGGTFSSFGTNNNSQFISFTRYDNRLNIGIVIPGAAFVPRYYDLTGVKVKSAVSWTDIEQPINDQVNASHALDGALYPGNMYGNNGNVLNTECNRFGIGRTIRTSTTYDSINGHISRLAYYSRRLTDSELETLTL